jgi:hypothetical protein
VIPTHQKSISHPFILRRSLNCPALARAQLQNKQTNKHLSFLPARPTAINHPTNLHLQLINISFTDGSQCSVQLFCCIGNEIAASRGRPQSGAVTEHSTRVITWLHLLQRHLHTPAQWYTNCSEPIRNLHGRQTWPV